ncbi:MAG: methionyl-tRNA formyltransferase [Bdellovibrionales bacterium]|nr:methionyl-tRNA formyltransferase [Bdellovibrionales bacterium]
MKYVFMGTPAIAASILEHLCSAGKTPIAVVTQPARQAGRGRKLTPSAVEQTAARLNLPVYPRENINSLESLEALKTWDPDLVLVVAFGQMLKEPVLLLPRLGCFNLHASLLPKYRGAAPVQRAIWNGEVETGVSIQRMVKALDAGDVLLQKRIAILPNETSGELLERLANLGGEAAVQALTLAETGALHCTPQDPNEVTVARKIAKEEAELNFSEPAQRLHDQVRALQPWPIAETRLNGQRLKVFGTSVLSQASTAPAGTALTDGKTHLNVVCGDGRLLALTEIQLENRKRLGVEDFLRGYLTPISTVGTF